MMCIALALDGTANSRAAAQLRVNSLFSFFFMANYHPFRACSKRRTKCNFPAEKCLCFGALVPQKSRMAILESTQKRPSAKLKGAPKQGIHRIPNFLAPAIVHSRSKTLCWAGLLASASTESNLFPPCGSERTGCFCLFDPSTGTAVATARAFPDFPILKTVAVLHPAK